MEPGARCRLGWRRKKENLATQKHSKWPADDHSRANWEMAKWLGTSRVEL
jgi:hypothetical protein